MNIGDLDFKYLKKKLQDDKEFHEKEFIQRIDPDLIDAYYEGDPSRSWSYYDKFDPTTNEINRLTQNRLFPTTSTIIGQLYPKNPLFVCNSRDSDNEIINLKAKISAGAINYYWHQMNANYENETAVMSAWLYGYGVTKQGWRTVYKKSMPSQNEKIPQGQDESFINRISQIGKKVGQFFTGNPSIEEQETPDYVAEDTPFLYSVNPKDMILDKDQPFKKGKYFHQKLARSIYDIKECGLYDLPEDFYNKFRRGRDSRETKVVLYESWVFEKGDLFLMVSCDEYDKPLRFDKMPYVEGFPFKILTFNMQVNRVYPISNMKVAQRQQRMVDYILTLQKEAIEKYKDITIFQGQAFDADERAKIRANKIGTNVFTKDGVAPSSTIAQVNSAGIPKDLFNVQGLLDKNVQEILSVIGAKISGQSEFDTATQEKIADSGNNLRTSAYQEDVEKFLIEQGKKLLQDISRFATAPAVIKVSGLNIKSQMPPEVIDEKWIEFGTYYSPTQLKDAIASDIDISIDVSQSLKRDIAVVRKQLTDIIGIATNPAISQALMAEGKKIKVSDLLKDLLKNFETISNADKYFEDLAPPSPLPLGTVPPNGMPMPPQNTNAIPTAESISAGASSLPMGGAM